MKSLQNKEKEMLMGILQQALFIRSNARPATYMLRELIGSYEESYDFNGQGLQPYSFWIWFQLLHLSSQKEFDFSFPNQ